MIKINMENILSRPIKNRENNNYFGWIKNGSKTYEGRLKSKIEDWDLYVGKRIHFYDEDDCTDEILVEVTELLVFDNFGKAFDALGSNLIPNRLKPEVINMYNELFHYDKEILYDGITSRMINNKGVVAIGFKILQYC